MKPPSGRAIRGHSVIRHSVPGTQYQPLSTWALSFKSLRQLKSADVAGDVGVVHEAIQRVGRDVNDEPYVL